jgi:nucleoside-diphosphate-sugar epimerase
VARDDRVTVLDNLSTGRAENLAAVRDRIRLVHGSVMDSLLVDELVAEADLVVHLAAAVGVRLVVERPLRSFLTNIRGSEVVLEAAHRYRRKVMLASTSEVYGKGADVPFREDDDVVLGSSAVSRWGYAVSKTVDEILAFAYHRERGLPVVIVRLFNTVGPRQTGAYGMVLPRFVQQALLGDPLAVYGDGRQSRCFCHVTDVVRALQLLLETPGAEGEAFNVGSTEEVTINDLANLVIRMTGSNSQRTHIPYEEAYEKGFEDMIRRLPDISKVRAVTGWEPARPLAGIVEDVIEYERAKRGNES